MVGTIVLFLMVVTLAWLFRDVQKRQANEIRILKAENLSCAKAVVGQTKRTDEAQTDAKQALEISIDNEARCKDIENRLTSVETQPKMEAKPKARTVPFRQFKAAAESLPEEA